MVNIEKLANIKYIVEMYGKEEITNSTQINWVKSDNDYWCFPKCLIFYFIKMGKNSKISILFNPLKTTPYTTNGVGRKQKYAYQERFLWGGVAR